MTAARKLQAVPSPQPPTTAEVAAELAAAQQAVSVAGAAVAQARADLDAAPLDFAHRAALREKITYLDGELTSAQEAVRVSLSRLDAARIDADKAALVASVGRIGVVAQMAEATADADEFVDVIGAAVAQFFARVSTRNLALSEAANEANALWFRLGHEHRCPGLQLDAGTGTAELPPRVSLESVHNWEHFARQRLEHLPPDASEIQQATRAFLLGALDYTRTLHALKQTAVHNHQLRTAAPAPQQQVTK